MAETLKELVRSRQRPKDFQFNPTPRYHALGDYLTYHFTNEDFYALRVNAVFALYLSMKTETFVGFKIKGVRHLCEKWGSIFIGVDAQEHEDGHFSLGGLVVAAMLESNDVVQASFYRDAVEKTKNVTVPRKGICHQSELVFA